MVDTIDMPSSRSNALGLCILEGTIVIFPYGGLYLIEWTCFDLECFADHTSSISHWDELSQSCANTDVLAFGATECNAGL